MNILSIESSCDETGAAVVADGRHILANVVASQVSIHARFGGIVPEVASRQHLLNAIHTLKRALQKAEMALSDLDAVAVTVGPGLAGSLLVGVNLAKALALAQGLPLIGINHLEAHLYAHWLEPGPPLPPFPLVCLIVSGGHTELVLMEDHGRYRILGATRDDAAGEAFDKVARLLGLGYPGGPAIERAAAQAQSHPPRLPRPWLRGSDDFSFSGLKTAALRLMERENIAPAPRSGHQGALPLDGEAQSPTQPLPAAVAGLAAAFQESVVEVLVAKTIEAAQRQGANAILLAGGVAANQALRQALVSRSPLPVLCPPLELCTDNAAIVAAAAFHRLQAGQRDGWALEVRPNLSLS